MKVSLTIHTFDAHEIRIIYRSTVRSRNRKFIVLNTLPYYTYAKYNFISSNPTKS